MFMYKIWMKNFIFSSFSVLKLITRFLNVQRLGEIGHCMGMFGTGVTDFIVIGGTVSTCSFKQYRICCKLA